MTLTYADAGPWVSGADPPGWWWWILVPLSVLAVVVTVEVLLWQAGGRSSGDSRGKRKRP